MLFRIENWLQKSPQVERRDFSFNAQMLRGANIHFTDAIWAWGQNCGTQN